jgi:hypothetical protein
MFASKFAHKLHTVEDGGYCIREASGNIFTSQVVKRCRISNRRAKVLAYFSGFAWIRHRCYFGHELNESEWGTH